MNKQLLVIPGMLAFAIMGACASVPSQVTLPDGTLATRIDCGGSTVGLNYCFEQAGKSCGAEGYSVVDPATGAIISTSALAAADPDAFTVAFSTDTKSIFIKCGTE